MTAPATRADLPATAGLAARANRDGGRRIRPAGKTVGDVVSRLENDGTVTFWRLLDVHRDRFGFVVTSEQVR